MKTILKRFEWFGSARGVMFAAGVELVMWSNAMQSGEWLWAAGWFVCLCLSFVYVSALDECECLEKQDGEA